MSFPCNIPCIVCPPSIGGGIGPVDPANPFVNLSSEDPDHDDFIGRRYRPPDYPPLGSTWYAIGCIGWCLSDVSQEDADLCAANQQVLCTDPLWPQPCGTCQPTPEDPFPLEPRPVFFSTSQVCAFACPDGTFFNFVTAPGLFNSLFNQATADIMAYTYACNKAVANHMCLGELSPPRTCAGSPYNGAISASTANTPVTFDDLTALPDGLLLVQDPTTAFIQGTPTTPGDYVFTLGATDAIGGVIEKIFELSVFGITNTSPLANANVGSPYSEVLVADGTVSGAITWAIASGVLPAGLTLNSSTGEISGTPTTTETQSFTVAVTNGGRTCFKQFSIESVNTGCPDWSQLTWTTPGIVTTGAASISFLPTNTASDSFIITMACANAPGQFCSLNWPGVKPTIAYKGPGCNCILHVEITGAATLGFPASGAGWLVQTPGFFGDILNDISVAHGYGVFDIPFSMPDTLGATINYEVLILGSMQNGFNTGALTVTGQFLNAP